MNLNDVENVVRKHLLLKDPQIIKLLCGFIIASRLPIDPPWLWIVSPPSGGKSTLLESLLGITGVKPMDNLTARTFASGMKGKQGKSYSLLDNVDPNDTLLFSDFTTFINKDERVRAEIMGQMRRIYDGRYVDKTGAGISTEWSGKLSVLAGVTEKIYFVMPSFGPMGERFLLWNFLQPEDKEVAEKASFNLDNTAAKQEMKEAFALYLNDFPLPSARQVDETTRKQIVELSTFICRARTQVERKKYHRDNPIEQVYTPEGPGRIVKQILGFGLGLQAINNGEITNDDRKLLCKMALDSIPAPRRKCLQALTQYPQGVETRALAKKMNYPDPAAVRVHLQDLAAVGVIEYLTASKRDRWKLKDIYVYLMEVYDGIRPIGDVLEEEEPLPEEPPPQSETEIISI